MSGRAGMFSLARAISWCFAMVLTCSEETICIGTGPLVAVEVADEDGRERMPDLLYNTCWFPLDALPGEPAEALLSMARCLRMAGMFWNIFLQTLAILSRCACSTIQGIPRSLIMCSKIRLNVILNKYY